MIKRILIFVGEDFKLSSHEEKEGIHFFKGKFDSCGFDYIIKAVTNGDGFEVYCSNIESSSFIYMGFVTDNYMTTIKPQ
jgi:hypothetical protein